MLSRFRVARSRFSENIQKILINQLHGDDESMQKSIKLFIILEPAVVPSNTNP
jgi:hypothetical protein